MYGSRGNSGFRSFAPVKVGDELDVKIEAVGEKGDGIAKKDGFVLFVPNTKEGEEVRIRVTKVLRKVGFADKIGEGEAAEEEEEKPAKKGQEEEGDYKESPSEDEDASEDSDESVDSENFGEDA